MQKILIRAIRRQMGWSRQELAARLGISMAALIRAERGEEKLGDDAALRLMAETGATRTE